MWEEPVRRKILTDRNIPPAVIDQFEAECPEAVTKINPLKKNSPKLYNLQVFDQWWDKRIRTQAQARRMLRRMGA
ncbi:MAG: hypothetical protein LUB60_06225 [Clostridiales bacterium]|nr:hypothetical protein [Clostridiales bacterium]